MRKRIQLRYKPERCLLTDVLPYEVPVTFTNRHLYDFLRRYRITTDDRYVRWVANSDAVGHLVMIALGLVPDANRLGHDSIQVGPRLLPCRTYRLHGNSSASERLPAHFIPFSYNITHKEDEFRELSVPHPRSQIDFVRFYDRYKETILYFASRSPFSIRRPTRIARVVYHKDRTHYESLADDNAPIEQLDQEYEHLRSFFVYHEYSNVYKFYESYRYHRCEKRYNTLLKLDISKCFDSIYTHSIVWAILGKESVKQNINASKGTFAGEFDKLMQRSNYNETHGIIIGPEISRVFAEMIFQAIDRDAERRILNSGANLKHGSDYEVFRYVDDYFIFYNDEDDKEVIVESLRHALKAYGLHFSSSKSKRYDKPIITEMSMAKRRISELLETSIDYSLTELPDDSAGCLQWSIRLNARALIIEFKTVLRQYNVSYQDVLNYTLAMVESRCERMLKSYGKASASHRSQLQVIRALEGILEFVFFIYSVSPKANTTIRLCRIVNMACDFCRAKSVTSENRHSVFKFVHDNIRMVLRKQKGSVATQVEKLNLLIALAELGRHYWLEEKELAECLHLKRVADEYDADDALNFFSITVAMFYMRGKVRYARLQKCLERLILMKHSRKRAYFRGEAELALLCLDTIACPFVSIATKTELLQMYGITDPGQQQRVIEMRDDRGRSLQWFTTWRKFNFGRELDRKKGLDVY